MINHLDGTVEDFDDEIVALNVNGIGFEVLIGRISGIAVGKNLRLYTVWRFNSEDGYTIFGFETPQRIKALQDNNKQGFRSWGENSAISFENANTWPDSRCCHT